MPREDEMCFQLSKFDERFILAMNLEFADELLGCLNEIPDPIEPIYALRERLKRFIQTPMRHMVSIPKKYLQGTEAE